jgi:hypothetical protein
MAEKCQFFRTLFEAGIVQENFFALPDLAVKQSGRGDPQSCLHCGKLVEDELAGVFSLYHFDDSAEMTSRRA